MCFGELVIDKTITRTDIPLAESVDDLLHVNSVFFLVDGHVTRPDDIAVRAQDCIRVAGLGSATVLDTVRI